MASMKVSALIFTYALMAVLLHPLLCRGISATKITIEEGVASNDGKTIEQGLAYVLMIVALLMTYFLH
ncbi:hypothetical protein ZIOFF_042588 [Zingiber officinale]|uniref:Uncharacterized protein n=2 Tax=Zingiber officinale TaxID=94328 RepID=A0A8J5FV31_ZINOF|nr:hypothetical protein ZIOFF_042588 [Zingiber officinale]